MLLTQTVHTTGVNVDGALATAVLVVTLMSPVFVVTIFILRSFIKQAVDKALEPIYIRLNQYGVAIARLEGVEEGRRQAVAAAGITTNQPNQ